MPQKLYKAMTIAGSDSGGGAGIQADLKTFAAHNVYGTSVITALTAQNTVGVQGVYEVSAEFVGQQLDSVMSDIGTDAAKTGMLFNSAIINVIAAQIQHYQIEKLVVDPVMIAKSGDALLLPEAMEALRTRLVPLAYVITPNIPEASALADMPLDGEDDRAIREAAQRIHALGSRYVLIKGGHRSSPTALDLLYDGTNFIELEADWVPTNHTHGTGCTLSAAITAGLACGLPIIEAVKEAKAYLTGALQAATAIGAGHSPVAHFYQNYK